MAFGKLTFGQSPIAAVKAPRPVAQPVMPSSGGGVISANGFSGEGEHGAGMGGGIADAERGLGIGKQWQGGKPWGKKKL